MVCRETDTCCWLMMLRDLVPGNEDHVLAITVGENGGCPGHMAGAPSWSTFDQVNHYKPVESGTRFEDADVSGQCLVHNSVQVTYGPGDTWLPNASSVLGPAALEAIETRSDCGVRALEARH